MEEILPKKTVKYKGFSRNYPLNTSSDWILLFAHISLDKSDRMGVLAPDLDIAPKSFKKILYINFKKLILRDNFLTRWISS